MGGTRSRSATAPDHSNESQQPADSSVEGSLAVAPELDKDDWKTWCFTSAMLRGGSSMIIALASPSIASTLDEGLDKIKKLLSEGSAQGAEIVCFPEAYLPGLRGQDFEVLPFDRTQQEWVLQAVAQWARTYAVATILGMERLTEAGRQIAAFVIDAQGQIQGYQTKNQLDPTEDQFYVPGNTRRLFEIDGIKFGVAICHEGWRYPETVRWAALRGAKIVFHPHHTGSDQEGVRLTQWGAATGPYYEKAMMMRSIENTIYFASVNYALRFQESATSLITPSGQCQACLPYGQEGVLVQAINIEEATGLLATRYAPERYQEFKSE
jgi:predicted amidohydrolase